MARHPVKKSTKKGKVPAAKKTNAKKSSSSRKSPTKKPLTDRERDLRAANLIANSEKKKQPAGRKKQKRDPEKSAGILDAVVEGMRDKKAKNIMVLDLQELDHRVCDYFVICDAESRIHVNSIADGVQEQVEKRAGERVYHSEGHQNGEWILLDYIDVVAHVFLREAREHYNIEALWGDAKITLIND